MGKKDLLIPAPPPCWASAGVAEEDETSRICVCVWGTVVVVDRGARAESDNAAAGPALGTRTGMTILSLCSSRAAGPGPVAVDKAGFERSGWRLALVLGLSEGLAGRILTFGALGRRPCCRGAGAGSGVGLPFRGSSFRRSAPAVCDLGTGRPTAAAAVVVVDGIAWQAVERGITVEGSWRSGRPIAEAGLGSVGSMPVLVLGPERLPV